MIGYMHPRLSLTLARLTFVSRFYIGFVAYPDDFLLCLPPEVIISSGGGGNLRPELLSKGNMSKEYKESNQMSDSLDLNHLQERSKGELIGLIEQMVSRHPDLEKLVALPLLPSDITKTVDGRMIRQRVIEVLPGFYYENSHYNLEASDELKLLMRMGQQYMQAAEWANAVTVYESVAGELLDEYEDLYDEDGEVVEIINHCVSQLGGCLSAIERSYSTLREQILMTLFDVYYKDADIDGFDMGHEVPDIVLAQSTLQEKEMMTKHIRVEVSEGGNWARQALGGFLLRLEANRQ